MFIWLSHKAHRSLRKLYSCGCFCVTQAKQSSFRETLHPPRGGTFREYPIDFDAMAATWEEEKTSIFSLVVIEGTAPGIWSHDSGVPGTGRSGLAPNGTKTQDRGPVPGLVQVGHRSTGSCIGVSSRWKKPHDCGFSYRKCRKLVLVSPLQGFMDDGDAEITISNLEALAGAEPASARCTVTPRAKRQ